MFGNRGTKPNGDAGAMPDAQNAGFAGQPNIANDANGKHGPGAVPIDGPKHNRDVAPKNGAKISDAFRAELVTYVKDAGKLAALTKQGTGFRDFGTQLAAVRSEFELLSAMWPNGLAESAQSNMARSLEGYDLALLMWQRENESESETDEFSRKLFRPYEFWEKSGRKMGKENWKRFLEYGGDRLEIEVWNKDDFEVQYWNGVGATPLGARYLPFYPNIGILMGLASSQFDAARKEILLLIK
jgi:hypothetical protein